MRSVVVEPLLAKIARADDEVLDLGGYDGSVTEGLQARGAHVAVLDLDESGLELARAKGMRGIYASAERIPVSDGHFDLVVCCDLLTNVPREAEAPIFREIARVLKPSGHLLLTMPDEHLRIPFANMDEVYRSWNARAGVTRERLEELARQSGLEICQSRDYYGFPTRLYYSLAFYKNLPRRGTRLKRKLWRYLVELEKAWCPAPHAHLVVCRPVKS